MTLAIALNKATKQRVIMFNPCKVVDAPSFSPREMRSLDADGARAYIGAFADDPDIGAAVVLMLGSGLRRSEALASASRSRRPTALVARSSCRNSRSSVCGVTGASSMRGSNHSAFGARTIRSSSSVRVNPGVRIRSAYGSLVS
ncbi:MAG: hypothetical protein WAJ94_13210 [Candidatus Cybelea sp.]